MNQRKIACILFDEFHSESWSSSEERAKEINPEDPSNSSYQKATEALDIRDFMVQRNIDNPLNQNVLKDANVLVIVHPCDPKWEKTTSTNSPQLSQSEINDIQEFVRIGGGLVVVTEYENDKYGNNLNDLLSEFGLQVENTTVSDRTSCLHSTPTWVFPNIKGNNENSGILHLVNNACFYRAASCKTSGNGAIAVATSAQSRPKKAGLIAISKYGKGRVVVITDSDIFGDEYIDCYDHLQLWLNIIYWVAVPAFCKNEVQFSHSPATKSEHWLSLKVSINKLRSLQESDGSINLASTSETLAKQLVTSISADVEGLQEFFPHQKDYLPQLLNDFKSWADNGFRKPDFGESLSLFNPQLIRKDKIEHLAIFPLYTPNASENISVEALIIQVPWPGWMAEIEKEKYMNDKFVPGNLVDFTDGYNSECAVLFPETVSLTGMAPNNFGIIFCDREAARYQKYVSKACEIVQLDIPPQLECFLGSLDLITDTFALWDLIHDRSHSRGPLPFDPFIFKQKLPFWMYALEELRVDLASACDSIVMSRSRFPFATYIIYAVLFDRIFRFAITGNRVKNYDALGGQLMFSFLHKTDVISWRDNKLRIKWDCLPDALTDLRDKLFDVYKSGVNMTKVAYWITAHDFISQYVTPNIASQWKKDSRIIKDESNPKALVDFVHNDEFPLGLFHSFLQKRVQKSL